MSLCERTANKSAVKKPLHFILIFAVLLRAFQSLKKTATHPLPAPLPPPRPHFSWCVSTPICMGLDTAMQTVMTLIEALEVSYLLILSCYARKNIYKYM